MGSSVGGHDVVRHKVMGFVGIQTGFGSVGRRGSLWKTRMPADQQGLQTIGRSDGLGVQVRHGDLGCVCFAPSMLALWMLLRAWLLSETTVEISGRTCSFGMFSNNDVTIGAWMLARNVNHENNKALCEPDCVPTSISVWDIPSAQALCSHKGNANRRRRCGKLNQESCSRSPTMQSKEDD
ncbi:hypothetical protein MLD38_012643 [Melastoma candidum]|uniref:Uncharacterized protein n=1 Tax=Melastoma candidum TaxID=119954 RepID=A0ACB9RA29_9MYRT|nr:hypothetical protein MLD38_012643 [Melastoma candidum]